MKVILLTSDYHISANVAIRSFLEQPELKKHNIEVAGVIVADQFNLGAKNLRKTVKYFRKMNPLFLIKKIVTNIYKQAAIFVARYLMPRRHREYYGIEEMAEEKKIPYLVVESVNDENSQAFIKKIQPDLLVSCFLLEIVKPDLLKLPKKGAINVHPALIQQHRGTFTAFWTLLKNWKRSGATVHYMNEKVDDGEVIVQKHFFVHPSDTIHCINKKSAILGGKLLVKALVKIKKNKVKGFKFKKMGKLFTMPTPADIKAFYAKGHSSIRRRDFFRI